MTTTPDYVPDDLDFPTEGFSAAVRMQTVTQLAFADFQEWADSAGVDLDAEPATDAERALYWAGYLNGVSVATGNQLVVHQHGRESAKGVRALASTCDGVPGWDSADLNLDDNLADDED